MAGSWRGITPPSNSRDYYLVGAQSATDFVVFDSKGNLHQRHGDAWSTIQSPVTNNHGIRFVQSGRDEFLCAAVDSVYHTQFFHYRNDHWSAFHFTADVPVRRLYRSPDNRIFTYGDWGRLYEYRNDDWIYISNPFENHITAMTTDADGNLWFGVRNEGVYRFDGEQYKRFLLPKNFHYDIVTLEQVSGGDILLLAMDGRIYSLAGGHFTLLDHSMQGSNPYPLYAGNLQPGIVLIQARKLFWYDNHQWKNDRLPGKKNITSVRFANDGSRIITARGGGIFIQDTHPALAFIDQAAEYYAEGNLLDNSQGAAFIDFNGDQFCDLFIFNPGEHQLNRVLLNEGGSRFIDISSQTSLDTVNLASNFAFEDFTGDRKLDVVFSSTYSRKNSLLFYQNTGENHFTLQSVYLIPQPEFDRPLDLEWYTPESQLSPNLLTLFYYSQGRERGAGFVLQNRRWGKFYPEQAPQIPEIQGWNRDVKFTDFNNDNIDDIYISSYWGRNRLLISAANGAWTTYRPDSLKTNSTGMVALDYDRDGDLDIVEQSEEFGLRIFQNDLQSQKFALQPLPGIRSELRLRFITSLSAGDFNNDGFPDLMLSGSAGQTSGIQILLNQNGQSFRAASDGLDIICDNLNGAITGDVDNDGDLDIFGFARGANYLWINQIDTQTYLKVNLVCSRSLVSGKGTKVWIYQTGHLDDPEYLKGYTEAGADNFKCNMYQSPVIHFGTEDSGRYDIKVRFASGKIRTMTHVLSGNSLTLREHSETWATLLALPALAMDLLRNRSTWLYTLIFLFALAATYLATTHGILRFQWSLTMATILIVVNYSLFWLLIFLLREQSGFVKYTIPLAVVLGGHLLPLELSRHLQHREKHLTSAETRDRLFRLLRQFNHGEWAMSTLNSLNMLARNAARIESRQTRLEQQILQRGEAFMESIQPNLSKIVDYATKGEIAPDIIRGLKNDLIQSEAVITKLTQNSSRDEVTSQDLNMLADAVGGIKQYLHKLKHEVYSHYSCNIEETVKKVTDALDETLQNNRMTLKRVRETSEPLWGLITNYELSNILDNCVMNAIRASRESEEKKIEIRLKKNVPRIHIEISDRGRGIPEEWHERIFENGFSGSQGTGYGLFQAREILQRYGGRICIQESTPGIGTIMLVELTEGVHS